MHLPPFLFRAKTVLAASLFSVLASMPPPVPAATTTSVPDMENAPVYGPQLEGFDYRWPVSRYRFHSQRQDVEMAYLDVAPAAGSVPHGTVVLLHGKNFCAGTWE